jgi:hypothetical protein
MPRPPDARLVLLLLVAVSLCFSSPGPPSVQLDTVQGLVRRLLPNYTSSFTFELQNSTQDFFQLSSARAGQVQIVGNRYHFKPYFYRLPTLLEAESRWPPA